MKRLRIPFYIFLLFHLSLVGLGQNFKFTWIIDPAFGNSFTLIIISDQEKASLQVTEGAYLDTITATIATSKLRELEGFLKEYEFPNRGSIDDSIVRQYLNTTFLPKGWVVVEGDTLLQDFSAIILKGDTIMASSGDFRSGLFFDNTKMQYYRMVKRLIYAGLDGTMYRGHYCLDNNIRSYEIYFTRFTQNDMKLNSILLNLIKTEVSLDHYYRAKHHSDQIRTSSK